MVIISRVIAQGAEILLFDEPTNNFDLRDQIQIMKLIHSLAKEVKLLLLANLAFSFSDKILTLHNREIFSYSKPSDVFTVETIKKVFEITVRTCEHHG